MSEILTKITFEFEKEDKDKVLNKIRESDSVFFNYYIFSQDETFIDLIVFEEVNKEGLEPFKEFCNYISLQEYEALEYSENNFIWEKEE